MSAFTEPSYWFQLGDALDAAVLPGEHALAVGRAEQTTFVRWNHGQIRQPGQISAGSLEIALRRDGRQVEHTFTLRGDLDTDARLIFDGVAKVRPWLNPLPVDESLPAWGPPVQLPGTPPAAASDGDDHGRVAVIEDALRGEDAAGLWTDGPMVEALLSNTGHRSFVADRRWSLEFSLYGYGEGTSQHTFSGREWDEKVLRRRVAAAREDGRHLALPIQRVPRGAHRVLFLPAAVGDLLRLLNWGGFSAYAHRNKQSPLQRLSDAGTTLSPMVTVREDLDRMGVPRMQPEGWLRPGALPLIDGGVPRSWLCSARTAKEYGIEGNGALPSEEAQALRLDPGTVAGDSLLQELGTGYVVAACWYLNWSDRSAARATGLTRFASFRVEGGEIVGPIESARFDDSLIDALSGRLIGLSDTADDQPDTSTWHRRQFGGVSCPAMLVDSWSFVT